LFLSLNYCHYLPLPRLTTQVTDFGITGGEGAPGSGEGGEGACHKGKGPARGEGMRRAYLVRAGQSRCQGSKKAKKRVQAWEEVDLDNEVVVCGNCEKWGVKC
jgi:hypothetical protein